MTSSRRFQFSEAIYAADLRFRTWGRIKNLLSRLDPSEPRANLQANALAAAFARKELATPEDAESAFRAFIAIALDAPAHLGEIN